MVSKMMIRVSLLFSIGFVWPCLASSVSDDSSSFLQERSITPDNTCGGANAYTCDPNNAYGGPCCSSSGYCGKTSTYCNAGCQWSFSNPGCNSTSANTCGGPNGYTCNPSGINGGPCCSASGYCGSSAAYCGTGCQSPYGTCYGTSPPATKVGSAYIVPGVGSFTQFQNYTFTGSLPLPSGLSFNTDAITGGPLTAQMNASNVKIAGGYLRLTVPGHQTGSTIQGAGIQTSSNILYASVRTYAIYSNVSGTCSGNFFYYNDTMEIDIEYLSNRSSTSNTGGQLMMQYTNQGGGTYNNTHVSPATGTTAVHEYRIDWIKGKTMFYTDGVLQNTFTGNVPTLAGTWLWNNWANGDPSWSVGPPLTDNTFLIKNIVMYYNVTS